MIAVIFEEWPAELKPELEKIDGFISVERFESLYEPGKLLSLSFWRDEEAVAAWRNQAEHRITSPTSVRVATMDKPLHN